MRLNLGLMGGRKGGVEYENLYVNPTFEGGADYTPPGSSDSPPDSHTFSQNTTDYTNLRDGTVETNTASWNDPDDPDAQLVRRNIQYAVHANNPDLVSGRRYRVIYQVELAERGGNPLVAGIFGVNNVQTLGGDPNGIDGGTKDVYLDFSIIDDQQAWTLSVRVGTGPTTTSPNAVRIRNPRLYDVGPLSEVV